MVEESGVFYGYALAALKSREFFQNQGSIWLPTMKEKYPKLNKTEDLSPAEVSKKLLLTLELLSFVRLKWSGTLLLVQ